MHVDWDWIKQRPHFIAEGLSKYCDLIIVYPRYPSLRTNNLTKNNRNGLFFKPFIYFPFFNKSFIISNLNKLRLKIFINNLIKINNPDYIWITFPALYEYIPNNYKNKIIYDCMDDASEFENEDINKLVELENKLIKKSSQIFVSSENLALKINNNMPNNKKTFLVRNAFDGKIIKNNKLLKQNKIKNNYKIGYIGTVSSWFDFESILFTLNNLKNIEYHIIGPVDNRINETTHDRIKFYGPIDHNNLFEIINDFDCMIMPFKLNKLVQSVDPVKLYEYINFNKPIISIFYKEIGRFSPFVNFYSNKNGLLNILEEMINNDFIKKYSEVQRRKFLENNTWDCRINDILNKIKIS